MAEEKSGLLTAIIAKPAKSGFSSDLSEDPKSEGPAVSYGGPPGAMPEREGMGDHSFRAVAKAFGIPQEKWGSAQAALKQYVKTCVMESEPDEDD